MNTNFQKRKNYFPRFVKNPFLDESQIILYKLFDIFEGRPPAYKELAIQYGHHRQRIGQQYTAAGSTTTKVYVGACEYITHNGQTTTHTYLNGPEGVFALHIKNPNGSENIRYIHKDHLGSWNTISDENGNLLQELSFDAWGNRRNPATWRTFTGTPPEPLFERGFTGHEHLYGFQLINMNGRVYDPVVSRMLSPDNFIQAPDFSQSFNRYSYCWNNPLVYTDPSGEFVVLDSWIIGFVHGFFSTGSGRWSAGSSEANLRAGNDAKIWGGLFVSDPNKSFGGRVWETVSRFTWQLPQTIGGFMTAQSVNTLGLYGGVSQVDYAYGATAVTTRSGAWGAVAQGSFIVGNNTLRADANNPLFQHEYGHYLQSQSMGWAYYPRVGIPSLRSERGNFRQNYPSHDFHPVEQDANRRAFLYFNENVDGFQDDQDLWNLDWRDNRGWDFWSNPLNVDGTGQRGQYVDYQNTVNLNSLDRIRVRARWYDHASWLLLPIGGPIWVGLINAGQYNR